MTQKRRSLEEIRQNIAEKIIAFEIASQVLSVAKDIGLKIPKLTKKNQNLLNKYREHIYKFESEGLTDTEKKEIEEELDIEMSNVEMFLGYLQEKGYHIK